MVRNELGGGFGPHVAARGLHEEMTGLVHDRERGRGLGMQEAVDLVRHQGRDHVSCFNAHEAPRDFVEVDVLLDAEIAAQERPMHR